MSTLDTCASIKLYQEISEQAQKEGFSTCACLIRAGEGSSKYHYDGEYHIFEVIDFEEFDGLIVSLNTIGDQKVRKRLMSIIEKTNKPVVAIDCHIDNAYTIDTLNYSAQRKLIEHLVEGHNYKKINYVSGPLFNDEAKERMDAYIDVMREYGIYDERRVYEGTFYVYDGKRSLEYYEKNAVDDYEAIVCANDMSALSVYEELIKRGKRIPEDVAITGYDDIDESYTFYPALTTVACDSGNTGALAISIFKRYWDGEEVPKKETVQPEIIYRESCGCQSEALLRLQRSNENIQLFSEKKIAFLNAKSCVEGCNDTNNFNDYIQILSKYVEELNPKEFYFCLYETYIVDFSLDTSQFFQAKINDKVGNALIALAYRDGRFIHPEGNGKNEINDIESANKGCHQYVCTPVHFRELNFGFVVFVGTRFPFLGDAYWEWTSGINDTLSGLRDRIKLNDLYMRDSLTGLYNRHGLEYHWYRMNQECMEKKKPMLFVFIDVDGLKAINDCYGHEEGDYTILAVAEVLREINDERIIAVRYGGDEFLLIGKNMTELDGRVLQKVIVDSLNYKKKGKPFNVSASTGIFVKMPEDIRTLEECIDLADSIMYANKKRKSEVTAAHLLKT